METKKSACKLMLLLKAAILIVFATVTFNASACGKCGYRCAYTKSYVTYKWVPGYYRGCCWVPGYRVAYVHCKKVYRTCYPRCVSYNYCNTCNNTGLFGWF